MLFIEPCAGLANRMLAFASAYRLARKNGHDVKVLWNTDGTLGICMDKLFRLPEATEVTSITYAPYHKRPLFRCKSEILTHYYQHKSDLFFDRDELADNLLNGGKLDADRIFKENVNIYIKSYCELEKIVDHTLFEIFEPTSEVVERGKEVFEKINDATVGMHIRRTDHEQAIMNSPVELFLKKAENLFLEENQTTIFLATDDEDVEKLIKEKYGNKVIVHQNKHFSRQSSQGMMDGLIDMLCLSKCSKIYGSYGSTFGKVASYIGNIELITLQTNHQEEVK